VAVLAGPFAPQTHEQDFSYPAAKSVTSVTDTLPDPHFARTQAAAVGAELAG